MSSEQRSQRGIETFAPDEWFSDRSTSSVWISGFRIPGDDPPNARAIGVHLPEVLVIIGSGELSYLDGGGVEGVLQPDGTFQLLASGAGRKTLPACNHLLLLTPFRVDGKPGNEDEARRRISSACAVLAVTCGEFIIGKHLFNNIVGAAGKGVTAASSSFRISDYVPRPALPDAAIDELAALARALRSTDLNLWQRVALALHWYEDAVRSEGRDGLIKSWIALEVLGMPDSTNIRPLNEALAVCYGLPLSDASERFMVGRLFGLRSRIVHNGDSAQVPITLLRYLQAVFTDVLYSLVGLPTGRRAEALLL